MSMYIILFIAYTFVFNTKIIISNMYLLNAIKSTSNEWSYLSLEKITDERNCYPHFISTEFGVHRACPHPQS